MNKNIKTLKKEDIIDHEKILSEIKVIKGGIHYEQMNGMPIINDQKILNTMVDYPLEYNNYLVKKYNEKDKYRFVSMLSSSNLEEYKKLFGKHSENFKGEFYFKVWKIKFRGILIVILSAKNYGSTIEIDYEYANLKNEKTVDDIIIFLKALTQKLSDDKILEKYIENDYNLIP